MEKLAVGAFRLTMIAMRGNIMKLEAVMKEIEMSINHMIVLIHWIDTEGMKEITG